MEKGSTSESTSGEKEQVTRRQFLKNLGSLTAGGIALRVFGPDKEKAISPGEEILPNTDPVQATATEELENLFAEVDYASLTDVLNYLEQGGNTPIPIDLVKDSFIKLSAKEKISVFDHIQEFLAQKISEIQEELNSVLGSMQFTNILNERRGDYAEVYKKTNNLSHALEAHLHAFDKIFTDIMPGQKQSFLTEISTQKNLLKKLEELHSPKI